MKCFPVEFIDYSPQFLTKSFLPSIHKSLSSYADVVYRYMYVHLTSVSKLCYSIALGHCKRYAISISII